MIVFHISNQFLDLAPVVDSVARAEGLTALLLSDKTSTNDTDAASATSGTDYKDASDWVVVARPADLAPLADADGRWTAITPVQGLRPWTDDYADVFDAFLRRQRISPSP